MSTVTRGDDEAIEYTDLEALKATLVGRQVVSTTTEGEGWERVISFHLDDGTTLRAHATHGGCACTNGCFTVENPEKVGGTILGVALEERLIPYDYGYVDEDDEPAVEEVVEPGSVRDGIAKIRLFVYDELGKHTLIQSEGSDNGYYGWGYYLSVEEVIQ